MFKKMRRNDKKMKEKKAIKILKDSEYGVLSTIGENKYCYGIPLNYVLMNNSIYFHSAKEGHKIDNLNFHDKVSFCVVNNSKPIPSKLTTRYESVIVFGRAEFVNDNEKKEALIALTKKFAPEFMEKARESIKKEFDITEIVKINIEHITGKKSLA